MAQLIQGRAEGTSRVATLARDQQETWADRLEGRADRAEERVGVQHGAEGAVVDRWDSPEAPRARYTETVPGIPGAGHTSSADDHRTRWDRHTAAVGKDKAPQPEGRRRARRDRHGNLAARTKKGSSRTPEVHLELPVGQRGAYILEEHVNRVAGCKIGSEFGHRGDVRRTLFGIEH